MIYWNSQDYHNINASIHLYSCLALWNEKGMKKKWRMNEEGNEEGMKKEWRRNEEGWRWMKKDEDGWRRNEEGMMKKLRIKKEL